MSPNFGIIHIFITSLGGMKINQICFSWLHFEKKLDDLTWNYPCVVLYTWKLLYDSADFCEMRDIENFEIRSVDNFQETKLYSFIFCNV